MISVIVPIYNAEPFLEQCINSIINQSYNDLDIILVDDGSEDNSGFICDKFAELDERIRVVHMANAGLVNARKTGVSMAYGDYVGFVDADDWIEPDMYLRFYNIIGNCEPDIVLSGHFEDNGVICKKVVPKHRQGYYNKDDLIYEIYPAMISDTPFFEWGVFPGIWEKVFKKSLLITVIEAVDNRIVMGEDAACVYPFLIQCSSAYILKECFYHYRQQAFSMVRNIAKNIELERIRFQVLYENVDKRIDAFRGYLDEKLIADFRKQWLSYVLFLMIPRADVLYRGISELNYLFPFCDVKKGDRIIIYGAGIWGMRLNQYLNYTGFCDVVAIADINYSNIHIDGYNIISPEDIGKYQYDSIVVASSFGKTTKAIYDELTIRYLYANIHTINEDVLRNKDVLLGFGLNSDIM